MIHTIAITPWLAGSLVALIGLCVGSFLNVVIYRLPQMMQQGWRQECQLFLHPEQTVQPEPRMTLSRPASSCPACQHRIRWYENIPLISWLVLRGKCSACGTAISWRYPLVELLTMLASIAVFCTFGATMTMLAALGLTWALIALAGIDFDTQLLPDRITLPLAAAGLWVNTQGLFTTPSLAIWGYVIGFLCLWVVYILFKLITGKEGMGYGDFKLLAALGAWLGPFMLPLIILLSSVIGAVIGVIIMRIKKENQPFAFGPYIAIAGWIALLWGAQIVSAYLGMYNLS
ncbi:MAG: A24 family peptidase [Pseudomonadota bacterium]|nr:A24 family peptidase [Pseudomonadota bacterium]